MSGKYLLVLLVVIGGALAQVDIPCHASFFQFTPRHNIDIPAYMGEWYMHEIAGSHIGNFPPPDYKCATRSLSLPNETDITQIMATDRFLSIENATITVETSDVAINNTRSPFTSMWYFTRGTQQTQVIILHADLQFNEWTTVYSCTHLEPDNYRYETVTAMTRNRTITPELRQYLKALMVGQGFRIGDHQTIDQTDC